MGHWYAQDGTPTHWVENKSKGGTRPTTLRDAKKLNLVPSVTEILKVADRPALTNWKVQQAYLQAMTTPRIEGERLDDFISRCKTAEREQLDQTADIGNQIHEAIETLYHGREPEHYGEVAMVVRDRVAELTGFDDFWIAEKTFAHPMGFGGMVDLCHPSGIVIDFKTKDFDTPPKRLAYDEHCLQLSAYAHGLEMPNARKINIFISRTNGMIVEHEWKEDMFDRFECLLKFWKLSKKL